MDRYVVESKSIRIYFERRPIEEKLQQLKLNGWRWNRTMHYWFHYNSSENLKLAKLITKSEDRIPVKKTYDVKKNKPVNHAKYSRVSSSIRNQYAGCTGTTSKDTYSGVRIITQVDSRTGLVTSLKRLYG